MTTLRQEKVSSLVQKEVASSILEGGFENLTGMVTITGVQVSADMEQAKVFFAVVGQPSPEVQQILHRHIYEIQDRLLHRLKMRKVPRIEFVLDTSGEYAQRIGKLIRRLKKDDAWD